MIIEYSSGWSLAALTRHREKCPQSPGPWIRCSGWGHVVSVTYSTPTTAIVHRWGREHLALDARFAGEALHVWEPEESQFRWAAAVHLGVPLARTREPALRRELAHLPLTHCGPRHDIQLRLGRLNGVQPCDTNMTKARFDDVGGGREFGVRVLESPSSLFCYPRSSSALPALIKSAADRYPVVVRIEAWEARGLSLAVIA